MVDEIVDEAGLTDRARRWRDAELMIDAVVGTGFKPPLRGLAVALREMVEAAEGAGGGGGSAVGVGCGFDGAELRGGRFVRMRW